MIKSWITWISEIVDNPGGLLDIPDDDSFWGIIHYVLNPFVSPRYSFSYSDPDKFSQSPVDPEVFVKILSALHKGSLSPDDMSMVVEKFSSSCTRSEWTNQYKPILEQTYDPGVGLFEFNRYAPPDWIIPISEYKEPIRFDPKTTKFPKSFYMEPYDGDLVHYRWVCLGDRWWVGSIPEGRPIRDPNMELLMGILGQTGINNMINVLAFHEPQSGVWTIRDIFVEGTEKPPLGARIEIMKGIHEQLYEKNIRNVEFVDLVESGIDSNKTNRDELSLVLESGFNGMIVRDSQDGIDVIVLPDKTSILKCQGVETNQDQVEYLIGSGSIGGKKFTGKIYHGLTKSQRSQLYKNHENLIGKKFRILSCGLDSNGTLSFPIFKGWN